MEETAALLLELGLPALARNNAGQTAFHFVCASPLPLPADFTSASFALLDFCINSEMGMSLNAGDNKGVRPIHLAATISNVFLAKLIEVGADPTALTHEGKSLLHIVARTRNANSVGMLLEHFSTTGRTDL